MNWTWNEFWSMGGYGIYVWGSYGIAVAVMGIEVWLLRARQRGAARQLKAMHSGGGAHETSA